LLNFSAAKLFLFSILAKRAGKKGRENEGRGFDARAAESDCPKSGKESMGQSKEENQKALKFEE